MNDKISVSKAILIGLLVVNGPVFIFLCGPLFAFGKLVDEGIVSRSYNWVGLPIFLAGFVFAWLWWSLTIARWRVWAYERVDDIHALKKSAVNVGLTWPDGHVFSRTEVKTKALASREQELDPTALEEDSNH